MFENISYQKKFYALIAGILITLFFAYKRSYSKTFDAINGLKNAEEKLKLIENSQGKIVDLEKSVALLDGIIGKNSNNPDIVQQEILNKFSSLETDSELVKLKEVHKAENEYFKIYTNQLIVSGKYNNVIETCYEFEKKFDYSRVISLSLYTEKNARTKRKKLFERIIFKNYEKNN